MFFCFKYQGCTLFLSQRCSFCSRSTCVFFMRSLSELVMPMDQTDQATRVITNKQEGAGTSTLYKISSLAKPPQSSVWLYEHKIQPIRRLISLNPPQSEGWSHWGITSWGKFHVCVWAEIKSSASSVLLTRDLFPKNMLAVFEYNTILHYYTLF